MFVFPPPPPPVSRAWQFGAIKTISVKIDQAIAECAGGAAA